MSDPIQDLIQSGRTKNQARKNKRVAREAREEAFALAQLEKLNRLALALIPDALRPYARIDERDMLTIAAPECAEIKRRFKLTTSREKSADDDFGWLTVIETAYFTDTDHMSDYYWQVFIWTVYQADDGWEVGRETVGDRTIDLECALAAAAEIGNNRDAMELKAQSLNAEQSNAGTAAAPAQKKRALCPLLSREYGNDCVEHMCALFIGWKGMDACSLKVLALRAADDLPREE